MKRAVMLSVWVLLSVNACGDGSGSPSRTRTPTAGVGQTPPSPQPPPPASATATMVPALPTPSASATSTGAPTATLVCPATETPVLAGPCTATATFTPTGTRPPAPPTRTPGFALLSWFDANPRYTSGVFLPLAEYTAGSVGVFTSDVWSAAARPGVGAAADGATLLLLSVELVGSGDLPVRLHIDADGVPSGGLFAVDDQRLVDRSAEGGAIDAIPDGPADLLVDTVLIGGRRWAFALYRAPRDYDPATPLISRARSVMLTAFQDPLLLNEAQLTIVRPLIIFLHGTVGDTSSWDEFALWRDSANELVGFRDGILPFYADRISFQWIALASGPLRDNAATVLPQIGGALESWKTRVHTAATQADVVTHSYGGPTARQVAQTQPDSNPLTTADRTNFRAVTNWGHGLIRKLVTLAGTHRGSALANSVAHLNQLGNGELRGAACLGGVDIGAGALADQLVLSPALRGLRETRLPGHAIIGSGTVQFADPPEITSCFSGGCATCYAVAGYHGQYSLYQLQDVSGGPYASAGNLGGSSCGGSITCENFDNDSYDRLANYFFNLQYAPPFTTPDCDLNREQPDYDLIVSACSSRGQQPSDAYSTVDDLDPSLRGRLSHTQLLNAPAVSERVRFVLEEPTSSRYFSRFAATGAPTVHEEQLMNVGSAADLSVGSACAFGPDDQLVNSCYLSCNSCEANADTPPCFVEYRVVPDPLVLRQVGEVAPLFVYGRVTRGPLDGRWTNVQSITNGIWCSVTMQSANDGVAKITTWKDLSGTPDQSGINVIEALADGNTSISLAVQNDLFGPIPVGVAVDTTAAAMP